MVAVIHFCFGVSSGIPKSVVLRNILAPLSAFVTKQSCVKQPSRLMRTSSLLLIVTVCDNQAFHHLGRFAEMFTQDFRLYVGCF